MRTWSSLTLLLLAPFSLPAQSLVGGWLLGDPETEEAVVMTFTPDGYYYMAHDGTSDSAGHAGMEFGTYSWDSETGAFSVDLPADSNGEWGLSHGGPLTLLVNGDTLTVAEDGDSGTLFDRIIRSPSNPLIGSWHYGSVETGDSGVITFVDEVNYFLAEVQSGNDAVMQHGTYTYNVISGALEFLTITTGTGDGGPEANTSHPLTLDGEHTFTIADVDQEGTMLFKRVDLTAIPEPSTYAFMAGLFGLSAAIFGRRHRGRSH